MIKRENEKEEEIQTCSDKQEEVLLLYNCGWTSPAMQDIRSKEEMEKLPISKMITQAYIFEKIKKHCLDI